MPLVPKILVADDSLTIQKVISMSLSDKNYQLFESLNEQHFLESLQKDKFGLILLDYTLSDVRSPQELCQEIHKLCPETPVILLLGAFDSVDELALKSFNVAAVLNKPFETEALIQNVGLIFGEGTNSVSELHNINSFASHESEVEEIIDVSMEGGLDNWSINEDRQEFSVEQSGSENDFILSEMSEWEVPIPDIIAEELVFETPLELHSEDETEYKLPSTSDLEYPLEGSVVGKKENELHFVHLNSTEVAENFEIDESTSQEDRGEQLKNLIGNELVDDFWKADFNTEEKNSEEVSNEIDNEIDEALEREFTLDLENSSFSEHSASKNFGIDNDELMASLIEARVKEYLDENLERIMTEELAKMAEKRLDSILWEMLPSLAENLVKKTLDDLKMETLKQ